MVPVKINELFPDLVLLLPKTTLNLPNLVLLLCFAAGGGTGYGKRGKSAHEAVAG